MIKPIGISLSGKSIETASQYLLGTTDCIKGKSPPKNASQDYLDGYSLQYGIEQSLTELSQRARQYG